MADTYIIAFRVDEEVDIDADLRKWLLEVHPQLGTMSYYDLLGVRREADPKEIKRAYFRLAGWVHPDRHRTKKLGRFKSMMEIVFARIGEAHDILRVAEKRAKYDATLGGTDRQAGAAPAPNAPVDPRVAAERQKAMDALKARFQASMNDAQKHVEAAKRAEQLGDLPNALEAYKRAAMAAPNDPAIKKAIVDLESTASERLVDSHAKKAALEEKFGRWAEAAASWQKVVEARPSDANARARLANALARAGR